MFLVCWIEIKMKSRSVPISYHHKVYSFDDKKKIDGLFIKYGIGSHTKLFNAHIISFDKLKEILNEINPNFEIIYKYKKEIINEQEYRDLTKKVV